MRFCHLVLVALLSFVLLSCGKGSGTNPTPPPVTSPNPPTPQEPRVSLIVFGAGYCTLCKTRFPELNNLIRQMPKETRKQVKVTLYLTAGDPGSVRPTEALALQYRDQYLPSADPLPDLPWRWTNFKKYFPQERDMPGAVVIHHKSGETQKFTASPTVFVPDHIMAAVQNALAKENR